jgi:hypothetical protein
VIRLVGQDSRLAHTFIRGEFCDYLACLLRLLS